MWEEEFADQHENHPHPWDESEQGWERTLMLTKDGEESRGS